MGIQVGCVHLHVLPPNKSLIFGQLIPITSERAEVMLVCHDDYQIRLVCRYRRNCGVN